VKWHHPRGKYNGVEFREKAIVCQSRVIVKVAKLFVSFNLFIFAICSLFTTFRAKIAAGCHARDYKRLLNLFKKVTTQKESHVEPSLRDRDDCVVNKLSIWLVCGSRAQAADTCFVEANQILCSGAHKLLASSRLLRRLFEDGTLDFFYQQKEVRN